MEALEKTHTTNTPNTRGGPGKNTPEQRSLNSGFQVELELERQQMGLICHLTSAVNCCPVNKIVSCVDNKITAFRAPPEDIFLPFFRAHQSISKEDNLKMLNLL